MDRETLLARKGRNETQEVTLGDGATLKIRKLTQANVEQLRRNYGTAEKALAGYRYAIVKCVLNDDGTPMFNAEDMDSLTAMSFEDIDTIGRAIGKFSGTADPNA